MDLRLELHIPYEPNYRQGKYQVLVGEARRGEARRIGSLGDLIHHFLLTNYKEKLRIFKRYKCQPKLDELKTLIVGYNAKT